jgi:hypothetical protein
MSAFGRQDGFSAFSASKSVVPKVIEYIRNQRRHHQKQLFEDEYLELLKLHEMDIVLMSNIFSADSIGADAAYSSCFPCVQRHG